MMISRVYLPLLTLSIIIGCSYTPHEIPPPSCFSPEMNKPAIFKPIEPVIDLNIITQTTANIEDVETEAETPAEDPAETPETVSPLEQNALHDIDFEMNNRIQWWIKRFTGPDKRYFRATLAGFDTIRPAMEKILENYGIPKDLVYICMIESGGRPNAISPTGATGYWQFTSGTAKTYKLVINSWVDERRDLTKSTHAAARYLKNLHAIFNDWLLAGAAYNAGEGNIYRIMKKYPEIDTFWDISHTMPIKHETLDYIPKLIATIVLAKNRAYYGLDESDDRNTADLAYETVRVPSFTYLDDIADLLKVPNKQIAIMNADLIRQCTPPSDKGHEIKVPPGTAEAVSRFVENMGSRKAKDAKTHVVKKGETLTRIAKANSLSVKEIRELNGIKGDDITIGQKLMLPVTEKKVEKSGKRTHTVAKGDTLSGISRRYGVSMDDIMDANKIKTPKSIRPKMVLKIPPKEHDPSPRQIQYTVKKGDTIWSISRRFEVTTGEILKWNKLKPKAEIHPGDELTIKSR